MPVERTTGGTSLIDVLDRVLDKGIVIDAWVRVSLVGIDLITVEARVVVASIDTYLKYSEAVGQVAPVARPTALEARSPEAVLAENVALRAQLAVAVTGVAGPGGGSAEKPVGTVWFGWHLPDGTHSEQRRFGGDRAAVRAATVQYALERLLILLG